VINDERFTIGELAERVQVTPRTIRYYTAEGVLPAPDTRGRYALYNMDHVHRLQLVNRLKLSHLPLNEIRERLNQLGPQEVEQLLRGEQPTPQTESAIEYLAHVLERPATPRQQVREQSAPPSAMYAPQSPTEDYQRLSSAQPSRLLQDVQGAAPVARPRSFLRRAEATNDVGGGETWQRLTLAPGVELHVQSHVMQQKHSQIKQLLERAQELFGKE
jgi:DNA-binding transcriptional MerR regulator